jgi:RNA polymerase sigma-70 factor (ECF subfamily)
MIEEEDNLIELAKGRDGGAFGQLYDRYHPRIYRFIYLKVGRREEAEDLAHQVFLSAWQHVEGYSHRGYPFSSWLYRIARNAVIDHYRTRRETQSIDEIDPENFADGGGLEAETANTLLLGEVRAILKEMKMEHQDVIIMRFVEELSLRETAALLQKSEGAVKLLQHRATKELKKRLESKKVTL